MTGWQPPYRVIVTTGPGQEPAARDAERLCHEGLAALQAGDLLGAERLLRSALAADDKFAEAHSLLGVALQGLGRLDEAVPRFERALALGPPDAATLNNLGNALLALGRPLDAVGRYEQALRLAPELAEVQVNLANALHASGRYDEARRHYRDITAAAPALARAHMNFGNSLKDCERYEEAIGCYQRALDADPGYVAALVNLGQTLQIVDRRQDAVECYRKALALEPQNAEARLNLGILLLSLGRLAEGWDAYASRWVIPGHAAMRAYPQPRWNGERIRGTLLVWSEHGIGDQVLCAGMLEELCAHAEQVVVEVDPRLVPLFTRSFPSIRTVPMGPQLYSGRADVSVPFGDLGKFCRPALDAFPRRERGYLAADHARVRELRGRLKRDGERVVGLSWLSRNPEFGHQRSARLRDFEALLRLPGCRFVDLQYGDTLEERASLERETGLRVERLADVDSTNDIDGLAALIDACDCVVTIDNTTVHLSGALGKPTWVLVPHGHARIWYWFDGHDDSHWYPCVRVRGAGVKRPWKDTIGAVAKEVAE